MAFRSIAPAWVSAALSLIVCSGCSNHAEPPNAGDPPTVVSAPAATDAPPAVPLQTADEKKLAEAIRRHQGHVVLVDYWATWCTSCVELLPHTVELHRQWADRGLVVISISFDDPQSEPEVRRVLAKHGASFENFLSPYGVGPRAIEAFDIDDGTLPHFRIYDRDGNEQRRFGGSVTADEIDDAVLELLEQP